MNNCNGNVFYPQSTINDSWFTKRQCVRDKNTQNIYLVGIMQNFSLISNILVAVLLRQRFRIYCNFSRFTYYFLLFYQIVANFVNNHATSSAMFLFSSPRTFCLLTGGCGAKITQNEKWRPFGGRCFNSESKSIFIFGEKNWIR